MEILWAIGKAAFDNHHWDREEGQYLLRDELVFKGCKQLESTTVEDLVQFIAAYEAKYRPQLYPDEADLVEFLLAHTFAKLIQQCEAEALQLFLDAYERKELRSLIEESLLGTYVRPRRLSRQALAILSRFWDRLMEERATFDHNRRMALCTVASAAKRRDGIKAMYEISRAESPLIARQAYVILRMSGMISQGGEVLEVDEQPGFEERKALSEEFLSRKWLV